MEAADTSLNDSGPYEKIEEEEPQRPPIGTLGDFISLNGDENKQDRLIWIAGGVIALPSQVPMWRRLEKLHQRNLKTDFSICKLI